MTKKKKLPFWAVMLILLGCLILACILSTTLGRYPISLKELWGIAWSKLPFTHVEPFLTKTQEALLINEYRILLSCMVGRCPSTAGACYQVCFKIPWRPDILGILRRGIGRVAGDHLAISTLLSADLHLYSVWAPLRWSFCGQSRGNRVVGLILAGVMISSLVSSCSSFIKLIADTEDQLPAITYWLMGSFNGADMEEIKLAAIPMVIGLAPIFALRWKINILSLGDEEARTLGVNAKRLRLIIIVCSALITAASVAVSGIIGWVGLVIPHMARRMVGNDYKRLIPATMLFGAIFMLLVDNICRNVWATDLPIGILTSFVGAPFFIYLITKAGDRL